MSTAAGDDAKRTWRAKAIEELDAAEAKGFEGLLADNRAWWGRFWSRAFVSAFTAMTARRISSSGITPTSSTSWPRPRGGLHAAFQRHDLVHQRRHAAVGVAVLVAQPRLLLQRADAGQPPRASRAGLLHLLPPLRFVRAGRPPAMGQSGTWIPETTWFNGLEDLPDDIAAEMRDLYLAPKALGRSARTKFIDFARNKRTMNSRWNWGAHERPWVHGGYVVPDKGKGPFGHVTHIFSCTAKIAYLYWLRYEYGLDVQWLRTDRLSDDQGHGRVLPELSRTSPRARTASTTSST